jgi:hypothetical protein
MIRGINSSRLALLFWEPVVPPCRQDADGTKLMFTIPTILQRRLLNTWRATVSLCAETRSSFCRPRHCHFVIFNTHSYSVISVVFLFREVNKFFPFIFPASKEITAPEEKSSGSSYQWASPITSQQFVREEGGVGQYRKGWFFLRSSFSFLSF